MKLCKNCPQHNRVCSGEKGNKKYCFFYHGHREEQTLEFDDLLECVRYLITEANDGFEGWITEDKFTLSQYGGKDHPDYFILILEQENGAPYPIGYIMTEEKKMKKQVTITICDICGKEVEVMEINYPVEFLTEQNEGKHVSPYYSQQKLDVCKPCLCEIVNLTAEGAQGHNVYEIRKRGIK